MLSYQHAYHAGNLADVHKHAHLAVMLDYLTAKSKPMSYIETHAGRGLYFLDAEESLKTGEAAAAQAARGRFPADHPYARCMAEVHARFGPTAYPGSPIVAALSLREDDRMQLAELHPQEREALTRAMMPFGVTPRPDDGLALALAATPPTPRRGLMLIDPSFEMKEDYDRLPTLISAVRRKWNVGIIALWYPLLATPAHIGMLTRLISDHPDAYRSEVRFGPARQGHRMIGSGMFVINPTWGLEEEGKKITGFLR